MKDITNAEVQILDRLMDTLDEGSVQYAAKHDVAFAGYVENLYKELNQRSKRLRRSYA